jgi:hypothetical protein
VRDTPLDPRTLGEIVEGTAGETGEEFFDALVRHLARATGKKCAWVTEWLEDGRRLRALSDEELDDLLRFAHAHSPVCQTVCRPAPVVIERVR